MKIVPDKKIPVDSDAQVLVLALRVADVLPTALNLALTTNGHKQAKKQIHYRPFDLAHLQRERGVSGRRVGEVLQLRQHRGAGDLLRASPHLPADGGAGGRSGRSVQEQESTCEPETSPASSPALKPQFVFSVMSQCDWTQIIASAFKIIKTIRFILMI